MSSSRPYQFSLRRLLFLSAAVAVALALARWMDASPEAQAIVGGYLTLLVIWSAMRWPAVRANLREVRERRKRILEERRRLLIAAKDMKRRSTP
jgi:hypothetical protein